MRRLLTEVEKAEIIEREWAKVGFDVRLRSDGRADGARADVPGDGGREP
jgi:hypothetical protein